MNGKSDRQIEKALFDVTVGIDDSPARLEFLSKACAGDDTMFSRITGWLDAQDAAEEFFRTATIARAEVSGEVLGDLAEEHPLVERQESPDADGPGSRIGRYRLLARIGEGGCGVVYLAEQSEPVRRKVALKIIRRGLDTESVIARFESERQSLALMDHPNIARVFDAGTTESGRPFFVMELVPGEKITDHCDAHRLGTRKRLELFIQVCNAIQHAHQKGVIHRDIKPSNILVTTQDGQAAPKVIDFGIARAVEGRFSDDTRITGNSQLIGTPAYMSPEQAEGSLNVDTRGDIYSLGVLLYELLVGRTPFDSAELAAAGMSGLRRILMEREPPSPLAALDSMGREELQVHASHRDTDPAKLRSTVKGDLNSVVMKAMEKDRRLRYETVNGLVMDLQRYIDHEPVFARPRNRMYLVRKFVRRNRVVVGAATGIAVSLMFGFGTAFSYYLRERDAREEQLRLHEIAEKAHAGELERYAEARGWEGFAEVSLLLSEGKTQEADELLRKTPLASIQITPQSSAVPATGGIRELHNAVRK